KGKTDSHTRVSIIDHDPVPLMQHVSDVPRQLERIVSKALAKDRLKRYQTITDLKLDLEQLRDEIHTSETTEGTRYVTRAMETDLHSSIPTVTRSQIETISNAATVPSSPAIPAASQQSKRWIAYSALGLLAVLIVVGAVLYASSSPAITSVAFLPFVNDSKDPNAEYLS